MKTCKKCRWWDRNGERGWCKHSPMWYETSTLHWCSYYERYATPKKPTEDNYKQRVWKDKMRFRMKIGQEMW